MKKARCYAVRDRRTCLNNTCNDVIIRIIIGEREWVHEISVIKQDRYGGSLGLGQISAPGSGNPAFPGQLDCLRVDTGTW